MALDVTAGIDIRISTAKAAAGQKRFVGLLGRMKKKTTEANTALGDLQKRIDMLGTSNSLGKLTKNLETFNRKLKETARLAQRVATATNKIQLRASLTEGAGRTGAGFSGARTITPEQLGAKSAAQAAKSVKTLNEELKRTPSRLQRVVTATQRFTKQRPALQRIADVLKRQINPAFRSIGASAVRSASSVAGATKLMGFSLNRLRITALRTQGVLAILGVGLGVRAFVEVLADFDQAMAAVAAITVTAQDKLESLSQVTDLARLSFEALREQALELGRTTVFTATESAQAMKLLAQAGFSANEVFKAIPGTLDLAVSGATGLATAANIVSGAVRAFALDASEATRVADVFATVVTRSNTNVEQLGEALKFVAPAARAAGISLEETAAAIGVLSDAGIRGTLAGTGLRRLLSGLVRVTPQASKALANMGLTLSDINPRVNRLSDVLRKFADRGLGVADAFRLFDLRGGPAAIVLTTMIKRFDDLTEAAENAEGAAAAMAKVMRDNLAGDLRILKSALQDAVLAIGDSGLTGGLRAAVQDMTALVRVLSGAAGPLSEDADRVRGLTAAVEALTAATKIFLGLFAGRALIGLAANAVTLAGSLRTTAGVIANVARGSVTAGAAAASISATKNLPGWTKLLGILSLIVGATVSWASGLSEVEKNQEVILQIQERQREITEAIAAAGTNDQAAQALPALSQNLDKAAAASRDLKRALFEADLEIVRLSDPSRVTFFEKLKGTFFGLGKLLQAMVSAFGQLFSLLFDGIAAVVKFTGALAQLAARITVFIFPAFEQMIEDLIAIKDLAVRAGNAVADFFSAGARGALVDEIQKQKEELQRQDDAMESLLRTGEMLEAQLKAIDAANRQTTEVLGNLATELFSFGSDIGDTLDNAKKAADKARIGFEQFMDTLGARSDLVNARQQASTVFNGFLADIDESLKKIPQMQAELQGLSQQKIQTADGSIVSALDPQTLKAVDDAFTKIGELGGVLRSQRSQIVALREATADLAEAMQELKFQMKVAQGTFNEFATAELKAETATIRLEESLTALVRVNLREIQTNKRLAATLTEEEQLRLAVTRAIQQNAEALEQVEIQRRKDNIAKLEGEIADEEFLRNSDRIIENLEKMRDTSPGIARGFLKASQSIQDFTTEMEKFGETAGKAIEDLFVDIAKSPENALESIRNFFQSMQDELLALSVRLLIVKPLLEGIADAADSFGGSGEFGEGLRGVFGLETNAETEKKQQEAAAAAKQEEAIQALIEKINEEDARFAELANKQAALSRFEIAAVETQTKITAEVLAAQEKAVTTRLEAIKAEIFEMRKELSENIQAIQTGDQAAIDRVLGTKPTPVTIEDDGGGAQGFLEGGIAGAFDNVKRSFFENFGIGNPIDRLLNPEAQPPEGDPATDQITSKMDEVGQQTLRATQAVEARSVEQAVAVGVEGVAAAGRFIQKQTADSAAETARRTQSTTQHTATQTSLGTIGTNTATANGHLATISSNTTAMLTAARSGGGGGGGGGSRAVGAGNLLETTAGVGDSVDEGASDTVGQVTASGDQGVAAITQADNAAQLGVSQQLAAGFKNTGTITAAIIGLGTVLTSSNKDAAAAGAITSILGIAAGASGGGGGAAAASTGGSFDLPATGGAGAFANIAKRGGISDFLPLHSFQAGGTTPSAEEVLRMGLARGRFGAGAIPAILHPDEAIIPMQNGGIPLSIKNGQVVADLPGNRSINTVRAFAEGGFSTDTGPSASGATPDTFLRDTSPGLGNGVPTTEGAIDKTMRPIVNVTINATDVDSFRKSRGQLASEVGAAVGRATQRAQ